MVLFSVGHKYVTPFYLYYYYLLFTIVHSVNRDRDFINSVNNTAIICTAFKTAVELFGIIHDIQTPGFVENFEKILPWPTTPNCKC